MALLAELVISLVVSPAKLVSPSVALIAKLVIFLVSKIKFNKIRKKKTSNVKIHLFAIIHILMFDLRKSCNKPCLLIAAFLLSKYSVLH